MAANADDLKDFGLSAMHGRVLFSQVGDWKGVVRGLFGAD